MTARVHKMTGVAAGASPAAHAKDVPIGRVAGALGLKIRYLGKRAFISCPACEDPSEKTPHHCELGGRKNLVFCHKCGLAKDTVGLVMAVRHCKARESFAWLRQTFGLPERAHQAGQRMDALTELSAR